jgi:predicted glutamine amidotransferase
VCKLFCIVDIENEDNALELAQKAVKPLTDIDKDGLGVILLGDNGLGVERWLKPTDFPNAQKTLSPILAKYSALLPIRYNSYGAITQQNIYAIGIHSRFTTGPKTLENVHPFVKDNIALIHNGVISNHDRWQKELSTCDSEALLTLYLENKVSNSLKNIQKIEDEAVGWYAFMVFNANKQIVDIMKDGTTPLFFANVPTVGTIFCTSDDIIKSCVGQMKLKQPEIYPFPASTAIRWAKGKDKIETLTIDPVTYTAPLTVTHSESGTCEHGLYPRRWCKNCQLEDDKDMPAWIKDRV